MSIKILMPALSPTMTEGNLSKWLVKEGDKVNSGDVIAEIETDKATMEIESADEGTVTKLLIKEGTESVPVNSPIAVLDGGENENDDADNKDDFIKTDEKIEKLCKILFKCFRIWKTVFGHPKNWFGHPKVFGCANCIASLKYSRPPCLRLPVEHE